jgi:hypothetical protein
MRQAWGKRASNDFLVARDGDHLLVPFECDLCIFRKPQGCNPILTNPQESLLTACIRRANLDSFWSRAKAKVGGNRDKVAFGIKMSGLVGLLGPYESDRPLPETDHCSYKVAIEMLLHSGRGGTSSEAYTQFHTVRKLRSAFLNYCQASAKSNPSLAALGDQKGK